MKRLSLLLCASLLGACSILPQSEPLDVYLLPASPLPAQPAAVDWALRVASPSSNQLLDSTRILVLPTADRVNTYQGVRWSERPAQLLQARLLDAFHDDGRIRALSSDTQRLQADVELVSELRAFHSQYQGDRAEALIQLDVHLVDTHGQRILASRRFSARQPADDTSVSALVAAFGQAGDRLAAELVNWTLSQEQRPNH